MARRSSLSPRKNPVQRRARQTVEAILEGAAQVFARFGVTAGTTNRIAERAGVSVGSLYQYFPSKEAILVGLLERHVEQGRAAMAGLLAEVDDAPPPLDVLVRRFVEGMVELHGDAPAFHRILFEETPRPRHLQEALHRIEEGIRQDVARVLRTHPEVRVQHPEATAWMLVQVVESATHRYVVGPPPELGREAFVEELTKMIRSRLVAG